MASTFLHLEEGGEGDVASLTPVPRTSITPVNVPTLAIETKSPRKKTIKGDLSEGNVEQGPSTPAGEAKDTTAEVPEQKDKKTERGAKSNFLKKLLQ